MGQIIYLDADGNRSEVTSDTITYGEDHWKIILEKHEKENKTVTKTKWIPRERVIEAEMETETTRRTGSGEVSSI